MLLPPALAVSHSALSYLSQLSTCLPRHSHDSLIRNDWQQFVAGGFFLLPSPLFLYFLLRLSWSTLIHWLDFQQQTLYLCYCNYLCPWCILDFLTLLFLSSFSCFYFLPVCFTDSPFKAQPCFTPTLPLRNSLEIHLPFILSTSHLTLCILSLPGSPLVWTFPCSEWCFSLVFGRWPHHTPSPHIRWCHSTGNTTALLRSGPKARDSTAVLLISYPVSEITRVILCGQLRQQLWGLAV